MGLPGVIEVANATLKSERIFVPRSPAVVGGLADGADSAGAGRDDELTMPDRERERGRQGRRGAHCSRCWSCPKSKEESVRGVAAAHRAALAGPGHRTRRATHCACGSDVGLFVPLVREIVLAAVAGSIACRDPRYCGALAWHRDERETFRLAADAPTAVG